MSLLIDVRTEEEFRERHAPDAVNVPVDEICDGRLGVLENIPKSTPIQLYCRSGNRSETAKEALGLLGFTDVTNLGGLAPSQKNG
ncbi:MAG: rhodanese-like domain-containing protein [bacterium]|nr:rhodanese-like domain-containing protein [bacterium]